MQRPFAKVSGVKIKVEGMNSSMNENSVPSKDFPREESENLIRGTQVKEVFRENNEMKALCILNGDLYGDTKDHELAGHQGE